MDKSKKENVCPGCRLRMPAQPQLEYGGYYHCSPECWLVYSEVLGSQFSNAVVFGAVHQMTVDAYAVQHAGGPHPDKSVTIHLAGLLAAFELGVHPMQIPGLLRTIADNTHEWPHFDQPQANGPLDISAIAFADSPLDQIERVQSWAKFVWDSWSSHHEKIAEFVHPFSDINLLR